MTTSTSKRPASEVYWFSELARQMGYSSLEELPIEIAASAVALRDREWTPKTAAKRLAKKWGHKS